MKENKYLKTLHHVVGIHLDPTHIKLHRPDVLEHLSLSGPVVAATHQVLLVQLPVRLVARVLPRRLLRVLLLEGVQYLELLGEEGLGIYCLDFECRRVSVPPR